MPSLRQTYVQRSYRFIGAAFGLAGAILLGTVIYSGTANTTIRITPKLKKVTAPTELILRDTASDDSVIGTINIKTVSSTIDATPGTSTEMTPGRAHGTVTIKNESSRTQPLAATTRLQSSEGVIVRIQSRVDVPARGEVSVEAIADVEGATGNVPAGRFTIVALHPSQQAQIYGVTTTAFTGGLIPKSGVLSDEALTAASNEAEAKLRAEVGQSTPGTFIGIDVTSVGSDPLPTVASDIYHVTVTARVITVTYPVAELNKKIDEALADRLAADEQIAATAAPIIELGSEFDEHQAVLRVTAVGQSTISLSSPTIQPSRFTDKSVEEIRTVILGTGLATDAQVTISPWWRHRTPSRSQNISVVVTDTP